MAIAFSGDGEVDEAVPSAARASRCSWRVILIDKNDAMVKISLPVDNQTIVASKYQLYLPTEQALIAEVKKEIEKLDQT